MGPPLLHLPTPVRSSHRNRKKKQKTMASRRPTVNGQYRASMPKTFRTEAGYNTPGSSQPAQKRKREVIDLTGDSGDELKARHSSSSPCKNSRRKKDEEKRLRVFRKHAPKSFLERLARVRTQRMFLLDRKAGVSEDGRSAEEVFDIAGSTGNVYQVRICRQPSCTCPDAANGNQCKHIIYVRPPCTLPLGG